MQETSAKLPGEKSGGKQTSQHLTPFYVCMRGLHFDGLRWQNGHFCPCLLDELLEIDLPQLFSQLLQFLFFVLDRIIFNLRTQYWPAKRHPGDSPSAPGVKCGVLGFTGTHLTNLAYSSNAVG